jgi:hypothetical protein
MAPFLHELLARVACPSRQLQPSPAQALLDPGGLALRLGGRGGSGTFARRRATHAYQRVGPRGWPLGGYRRPATASRLHRGGPRGPSGRLRAAVPEPGAVTAGLRLRRATVAGGFGRGRFRWRSPAARWVWPKAGAERVGPRHWLLSADVISSSVHGADVLARRPPGEAYLAEHR